METIVGQRRNAFTTEGLEEQCNYCHESERRLVDVGP